MDQKQFLIVLTVLSVVMLLTYACRKLLVVSQSKEDREDEQLWRYLLRPQTR
jgi:hypothetical protein